MARLKNHTNNELSVLLSGKWELEFSNQAHKGWQAQTCFRDLLPELTFLTQSKESWAATSPVF